MSKATIGTEFDYLINEIIIPRVSELLADECHRPDFDFKLRTEFFSPRVDQRVLFLKSPPLAPASIRTAALRWILSAAGVGIYYVERVAGGDPGIIRPDKVLENGAEMTPGAAIVGLTAGQFYYGTHAPDALGFDTVYVNLSDSTDPDSKAVGYVRAGPSIQVWQSTLSPRDFTTPLTRDVDYSVDTDLGIIERPTATGFYQGLNAVKVSYWGGFLTGDGQGLPPLLKGAALDQAKMMFDRREELGVSSRSVEGGSLSLLPLILPPDVKKQLRKFRLSTYC